MSARAAAGAVLVAALSASACGRAAATDDGARPETAEAAARRDAALHLREADDAQARAESMCDEGDRLLAAGSLADARRAFLGAGRLFEAASRERSEALDAAASVRTAWADERSPK